MTSNPSMNIRVPDGCEDHDVTQDQVDGWLVEVARRYPDHATRESAVVSVCACCLSPCAVGSPVCKYCIDADLDMLRRSRTVRGSVVVE